MLAVHHLERRNLFRRSRLTRGVPKTVHNSGRMLPYLIVLNRILRDGREVTHG